MKSLELPKLFLTIFMFFLLASSCKEKNTAGDDTNLPVARGDNHEIIFVMDSLKQVGKVGQVIKDIFLKPYPGLLQDEAMFDVRFVEPRDLNSVLRLVKNLVYVSTLDDNTRGGRILLRNFTDASIQKIRANPEIFMFSKQNQYARGQEVLHLFGNNEEQLIDNLQKNASQLRQHFLELERKRVMAALYKSKENKKLEQQLLEDYEFTIRVPFGYDVAKTADNFVWLRQYDVAIDKNIIIYFQEYTSQEVFTPAEIVKLRNQIGYEYLRDVEHESIYMTTEERAMPELEEFNFHEKYAVKTRWYWKLSNLSRGGAFVSYCFVDEDLNRLYYIEGYVDSPGIDKRNSIVELETILSTFKTKGELKSVSAKENS